MTVNTHDKFAAVRDLDANTFLEIDRSDYSGHTVGDLIDDAYVGGMWRAIARWRMDNPGVPFTSEERADGTTSIWIPEAYR